MKPKRSWWNSLQNYGQKAGKSRRNWLIYTCIWPNKIKQTEYKLLKQIYDKHGTEAIVEYPNKEKTRF
jgi:hypothetical protein